MEYCIIDQVQICLNGRITTSKFSIAAVTDKFYSYFTPYVGNAVKRYRYLWSIARVLSYLLYLIMKYLKKVQNKLNATVLPAKSDSDVMLCLQSYQGLRIDRSLCIKHILWIGLIHKWSTDSR